VLLISLFSVAVAAEPAQDLVTQGRQYVVDYECDKCHRINGKGGEECPELAGVFERRKATFIRSQLADPTRNNPNSNMPQFEFSDDQIEAIMAYLGSLKGDGRTPVKCPRPSQKGKHP
jgi:cytochrome c oxidase subunit II